MQVQKNKTTGISKYVQEVPAFRDFWYQMAITSDESEPSCLEPGLELNNFQLGLARLVNFSAQLENFSI